MTHDLASSTYIAERVARKLYPQVIVAVPIAVGISEHHMFAPGTLTAKPGSWLAVLFDAVESLVRHGIGKVLILNGHGGNVAPVQGAIDQWRRYLRRQYPGAEVRFHSYWDLIPPEFAGEVLETGRVPGHAQEFETAFALYAFPESVRRDAISDQEDQAPSHATTEKGKLLVEKTVEEVARLVEEMLVGPTC